MSREQFGNAKCTHLQLSLSEFPFVASFAVDLLVFAIDLRQQSLSLDSELSLQRGLSDNNTTGRWLLTTICMGEKRLE